MASYCGFVFRTDYQIVDTKQMKKIYNHKIIKTLRTFQSNIKSLESTIINGFQAFLSSNYQRRNIICCKQLIYLGLGSNI